MVDVQDVRAWLSQGNESRFFEVKGPGLRKDTEYMAKVARAVMAMGNLHDGGLVCLGIEDRQLAQMSPGLTADELKQWSDSDEVNVALARFIDPPADIRVCPMELRPGVHVVVLEVREFFDLPHLCRRSYPDKVQEGHLYVRSRGKPQSVPVSTTTQMREIMDLATEKALLAFVRRAQGAGLVLPGGQLGADTLTSAAHISYQREYEQAWASPSTALAQVQQSVAFFDVAIRPRPYRADRLQPGQLVDLVRDLTVRLRGWPLPFVDNIDRSPLALHGSWVGQDYLISSASHREAWRIWSSGQFLHRRVLTSDDRPDIPEAQASVPSPAGTVIVWDVLLYLVEAAEFASRLAAATGCDGVDIDVWMHNVQGRQLVSGDPYRDINVQGAMSAQTLHGQTTASRPELLTQTRQVGVRLAQTMLQQFGLHVPEEFLLDWQDEVFST